MVKIEMDEGEDVASVDLKLPFYDIFLFYHQIEVGILYFLYSRCISTNTFLQEFLLFYYFYFLFLFIFPEPPKLQKVSDEKVRVCHGDDRSMDVFSNSPK